VNRALNTVRSYYEWLIGEGKASMNPARKVKQARTDHVNQMDVKWLTPVETERLYLAVSGEKDQRKRIRDEAIISLMLYAGLRVSEVTDLEVADVNLARGQGVITVREGKGDLWRAVPVSDKLRKTLTAWMDTRAKYDFAAGSKYVFVSRKAGQISRFTLDQIVKKYMQSVGIMEHSCHSLRHTFAKRLAESNVRLEEIAKLCGHASIQTTMIYTQPGANELRDAVNRL
jgi:integrase/recombinase XerC